MTKSLSKKLREIFKTGKLYTVEQLSELCDVDKNYVSNMISRLKSPNYCGSKHGRLDLTLDIGYHDGKHRWGLRGAREIHE